MNRLFGTDGIRGRANRYPMIPETAVAFGRAVSDLLAADARPKVVIGADTRQSSDMLAAAAAAGVCSAGADALMAGVIPTPAVARLTVECGAAAGIVVSASHNPFEDNGLKVFSGDGFKPGRAMEQGIEERIRTILEEDRIGADFGETVGRIAAVEDAEHRYLKFLRARGEPLSGLSLVLDCANGAAHRVAPELFSSLGANVSAIGVCPDGRNINAGCGSEHPDTLAKEVRHTGADLGLALDGDGDRLVAVDETGAVITGDQIIAICAADMKARQTLSNNRVVTTVMSNVGLGRALEKLGIEHRLSDVGDRKVVEEMRRWGAVLGGEDSGHVVFLDSHTTGDGLFAALRLLGALQRKNQPLSRAKSIMTVYPQVLINVKVAAKPTKIAEIAGVSEAIREVENSLKSEGRVLVRYSGTQPVCRVMVEGPSENDTRKACEKIARAVADAIGK